MKIFKFGRLWRSWNRRSFYVCADLIYIRILIAKVRRMMTELDGAEAWEKELDEKLCKMEKAVKPPLLQIYEKLDKEEDVEQELLLNGFKSSQEDLLKMLKDRVGRVRQMERSALMKLVDLLLRIRHLTYGEGNSSANEVEALLRVVVREIGRLDINWVSLADWEEMALKGLMSEVGEVPGFLIRLVEQLLERTTKKEIAVQTE